jgi:indole-3-glycerol phosphate synthase
MLGAAEPAQWEDAAASQGIRIRRHRRPTASMREIEEEMGAPRNILEKIIWDKEIEVAEVCCFIALSCLYLDWVLLYYGIE